MNTTGKKNRKNTGMNRYSLHHARHSHKSKEKMNRMGWVSIKRKG